MNKNIYWVEKVFVSFLLVYLSNLMNYFFTGTERIMYYLDEPSLLS